MARRRQKVAGDLVQGAERFARWRRQRVRGERIPESLWKRAVELARKYGVSRTANALEVGYYDLQKQVAKEVTLDAPAIRPAPVFVELAPAVASERGRGSCLIEFEKPSGSRLRIQFPESQLLDPIALVRSFWDAG